jgi:protoporphyrin/coproporphyrin ferrochelatase
MSLPPDHPTVAMPRIGVLLVNLGTPDAPTTSAVKRYLKQFLSDRRVVEISPLLWQPILRGIILNIRPKKSAANYAKVWTDKGSPLAFHTIAQTEALAAKLKPVADVRYAMRYGNPSIANILAEMKKDGCNRILIAPLYPQYSGATTGTVQDEVFRVFGKMRWQPAVRTMPAYHDDPAYIGALKTSLEKCLAALDFEPDVIVASFHGMPERTLHLGDPYHCQCRKTARLLSEAMGRELVVSFQSRFGPAKWLEPATDDTLERLGKDGKKKLVIFAPGFSSDCLETLEELAMEGREIFQEAGGTDFAYVACLNDSDEGMAMLDHLVRRDLAGWL